MQKRTTKRTRSAHYDKTEISPNYLNLPAAKLPTIAPRIDFRSSMHWRIFRIVAEFIDGFQYIADFKKTVSVFGSTRIPETNHWYKEARRLGKMLSKDGFTIVTGGGPGIMEAANRGAHDAKGASVGINIQLPREQRTNPYVNTSIGFHYFFTRKLMLTYSAEAYVYFPGGYGTLDEFFEIITLIQTKKIATHIPIVLVGKDYWKPFEKWMTSVMYERYNGVDKADLKLFEIVDSAEEAFRIIKRRAKPRHDF
ncbi:MAG: hypothetical protein RL681_758 [Candidatus Parcubacteria bacterium]|jgi:uncharacterized protein (TIGR00730 family)